VVTGSYSRLPESVNLSVYVLSKKLLFLESEESEPLVLHVLSQGQSDRAGVKDHLIAFMGVVIDPVDQEVL
jgi:hypothetical protein